MPDFGTETILIGKTLNPTQNIVPYYGSTGYDIYQSGGLVWLKNNLTGVSTSYTNLDLAVNVVLGDSNDPSVTIHSGWYNLSAGFTGWNIVKKVKIICEQNVFINVPQAYTGIVYNCSPTGAEINDVVIDGGWYDEQGTQANDWTLLKVAPVVSGGIGAVYENKFMNMMVWRCSKVIYFSTTDTSWANQNLFENIYGTAIEYLGYFEHNGTYTVNQSGMQGNTFRRVSCQSTLADGTNHYPLILGGFINVFGQWNYFEDCNVWDIWQNSSAISFSFHANANGNRVVGGLTTVQNYVNNGTNNVVDDQFQGFDTQKPIKARGTFDSYAGFSTWNDISFYGRTTSWSPAFNVAKRATAGSFEQIAFIGTDATTDTLSIENGTGITGAFSPILRAMMISSAIGAAMESLHLQSYILNANDTGTAPHIVFSVRTQTTPFTVGNTRPILQIRNYGTNEYSFYTDKLDLQNNGLQNAIFQGMKWALPSTKTTDVTAALDELIISVSASGGNRILTLPTVANAQAGRVYVVQKTDSSANTVTVDGNGSETINGAANFVLTAQFQSILLWCDGAEWKTQLNTLERGGKATANGNGSTTVFNIAHGLGSTPNHAFVQCQSHNIGFTYTTDSTNITVTFASAPGSGTNNVIFNWKAVK